MMWVYRGIPITEDDIKGYVGFVYLITNIESGKRYIGKKVFVFSKTKQIKGRKRRIKVESDWKDYFGSCKTLLEDLKVLGKEKFYREILYLCETKKDLTYYEVREQFMREVLEKPGYYNENIQGRFFIRNKEKNIPFVDNLIDIHSGEHKWPRPTKKSHRNKALWVKKAIATRKENSGGKWTISKAHKKALVAAHTYVWEVQHPCGKTEIVKNLRQFCIKNNLSNSNLIRTKMNGGHLNHHKGFKCKKVV